MRRIRRGAALLAAAIIGPVLASAPPAQAEPPPGCHPGMAADAAESLYGPGARVDELSLAEGVPTALVLTTEVLPFVRHRMLAAGPLWCDSVSGFGAVIDAHELDIVRAARLFASTAAAPYFDGVDVETVEMVGDTIHLSTHARTNGVLADWAVSTDGHDIVRAEWTSRQVGVSPFEPQLEGLTAFPGASLTYVADDEGALVTVDDPLAQSAGSSDPVATSVIDASDGFRIVVSRGTPYVYATQRTGIDAHDVMAIAVEGTRDNYEEFLDWGLSGQWEAGTGHVFLDGGLAAFCMACVVPSSVFNVHISSAMAEYAELLGYHYPDPEAFFRTVLGHEIFHNFQTSYAEAQLNGGLNLDGSYVEGLARFQETLHAYSEVSHQPDSVVYQTDGGGVSTCNDYLGAPENTYRMEQGFVGRVYSACYFWMSLYADEGLAGLRRVLQASAEAEQEHSWFDQMAVLVEAATGAPPAEAVERFAVRALTGAPLEWGPAAGGEPVLDWRQHLLSWAPGPVEPGAAFLGPGGVTGGEVVEPTLVTLFAESAEVRFLVVTQSAAGAVTVEAAVDGATVEPPPDGHRWLIAVAGSEQGSVELTGSSSGGGEIPSEVTLERHETDSYSDVLTPLQSASSTSSGAVEDLSFAIAGEVDDPLPGTLYSTAWAYGSASTSFSTHLAPGRYQVEIPLTLTMAEASTLSRYPTDTPQIYVDPYLIVWTDNRGWFSYSPFELSPGTHELTTTVELDEASAVTIEAYLGVDAFARGGSAAYELAGHTGEPSITPAG